MKIKSILAAGALIVTAAFSAEASVTFDFEGVALGAGGIVPSPYGGFVWTNVYGFTAGVSDFATPLDTGNSNTVGYNGYAADASIAVASGTFTFNGGDFARGYSSQADVDLTLTGLLNGIEQYVFSQAINSTSVYSLSLDWENIDELVISGDGRYVSFDHLEFNGAVRVAGAVPEPAAWLMMLAGFALTGAALKRRNTVLASA